jgi:hypothetical protein
VPSPYPSLVPYVWVSIVRIPLGVTVLLLEILVVRTWEACLLAVQLLTSVEPIALCFVEVYWLRVRGYVPYTIRVARRCPSARCDIVVIALPVPFLELYIVQCTVVVLCSVILWEELHLAPVPAVVEVYVE